MRFVRTRLVVLVLAIAGLAVLLPISGAGAATTVTQSLAFVGQPTKTVVNQYITTGDLSSGGPITVAIRNSNGSIDTTSSAPVTMSLASDPGGGILSGTLTVNAVNGVATFSDLSINRPGVGYKLLATSPGIAPATSRAFDEVSNATRCSGSGSCSTSASTPTSVFTLTLPGGGTSVLSVSADVGAFPLVCPGYAAEDPNWYSFLSTNTSTAKVVTYTVQPLVAGLGSVDSTQFCLGAPYTFVQRGGGNAPAGVLPDGSKGYIGLLPDCSVSSSGPCIASRSTTPDSSSPTGFDVVLNVNFPAGLPADPWGRA